MDTPSSPRPAAVPWPPLLLVVAIAAGFALRRLYPLAWPGLDDPPARVIGFGLGIGGVGLMAWGLRTLVLARTNVWPHRRADHLVTAGPFRIWRNPIYMGEVLILLGLAQASHNIWFAILAPLFALAVFKLAIQPEEAHLEARFGDTYLDYKNQTRRWF
jgi:protein-S-isoprenylcysteine O-methyltransferase Ste14